MALSLNDKGYSCFNIKIPSIRDLAEIAKLSGPLILTMISKVHALGKTTRAIYVVMCLPPFLGSLACIK